MERIVWSDAFKTGHAVIDQSHKVLFESCNRMVDHQEAGETSKCANALVDFVGICTVHFDEEKEVFENLENIRVESHLKDHKDILDHLGIVGDKCRQSCRREACLSEVMHSLITHILKHDLSLQKYYNI
jgi:hemerythrin-like metal-binding protein